MPSVDDEGADRRKNDRFKEDLPSCTVLLRKSYTHLATRISSSMNVVSIQPALVPGISGNLTLRGGSVDDTSRPSSVLGEYCELRKERVRRLSPSKEDAARTCPRGNGTPIKKQIYLFAPKNKQALLLSFTGVVPRSTRSALFVKAQRLRGRRSGLLLNTPNRLHPCGASIHPSHKTLVPPNSRATSAAQPKMAQELACSGGKVCFRSCMSASACVFRCQTAAHYRQQLPPVDFDVDHLFTFSLAEVLPAKRSHTGAPFG